MSGGRLPRGTSIQSMVRMIIKRLPSADRVRNHMYRLSSTMGGGITKVSSRFAATLQMDIKKGITDIHILTAALLIVHANSMNRKMMTIIRV